MRICATVNAEEESSRGSSVFSKTTHHFQITKKTGVKLPEQGQMFRQSTASTKLKGKAFGDLFGFSTDYGLPAQPRLKLLPYKSPTYSNGEEDVRDDEAYALESSSETDILDMDAFQDNLLPGSYTYISVRSSIIVFLHKNLKEKKNKISLNNVGIQK
ncbi:hypothetical protein ACFX2I_003286 [Malus domestica]